MFMKYLVLALIAPCLAAAQTKTAVDFDVAAIRPNKSGSTNSSIDHNHGQWRATNVTVKSLLLNAFEILPEQIVGAPGWVDSETFDIDANAEYDASASLAKEAQATRQRLQSLLADRFGLEFHRETKQLQTYALIVGKKGPKLTPASNPEHSSTHTSNGHMDAKGISMEHLARSLAGWLGRPVVNETGLEAKFDLTLDFEPERAVKLNTSNTPIAGVDSSKPTLMTAVQDQLGLKLESRRSPVEMLVVDRISRPSEN